MMQCRHYDAAPIGRNDVMFVQKHQHSDIIPEGNIIVTDGIICRRHTSFKKAAFVCWTKAAFLLAETEGFEPSCSCLQTDFESFGVKNR